MKEYFIQFLCCPITKQPLQLQEGKYTDDGLIREGKLVTADGKYSYPIVKGIPRFVSSELYSGTFGYEWKKWARVQYESDDAGHDYEGNTTKTFRLTTLFTDDNLKGKMVVEFGCGGGRFMDVALRKGATVIGIDMSMSVEPAYENLKKYDNYLIVQGDILNPPFKENSFDLGYCIGVLHHTPNPEKGLKELFKTLKTGGIGVCLVYVSDGWYASKAVAWYRKVITKTRPVFGYKLALLYSNIAPRTLYYLVPPLSGIPLFGKRLREIIERNIFVVNYDKDLRWRILDTFDAITPEYASTHTEEEVRSWFQNIGCKNIQRTEWNKCGYRGVKP